MAKIGGWVGTGGPGCWRPAVDPARITDPRFAALHAAAAAGIDFGGVTALITGAGTPTSIGARIAANFTGGGAQVVIADVVPLADTTRLAQELAAEAGAGRLLPARVDQGDLDDIDRLWAALDDAAPPVTHLYPMAVIHDPRHLIAIRPADYARIFGVNTFGVYHLVIRHLRRVPRDQPFFVCLPLSPNDGRLAGSGLYSPSKQALRSLVRQGQHEFGDRRGGVYTGIDIAWTRSALMAPLDDRVDQARAAGLATFTPQETADCCTLLGTPAAAALRGEVLDAGGNFGATPPAIFDRILRRE
jgi:NAD(P)-dependent dehydrogenase (short-subunit alcohol dehydrogenase family)